MSVGWSSSSHAPLNIVHSVHYISGRNNANMSWIFFKSLLEYPGNLLEICSVKSVDTLTCTMWNFFCVPPIQMDALGYTATPLLSIRHRSQEQLNLWFPLTWRVREESGNFVCGREIWRIIRVVHLLLKGEKRQKNWKCFCIQYVYKSKLWWKWVVAGRKSEKEQVWGGVWCWGGGAQWEEEEELTNHDL